MNTDRTGSDGAPPRVLTAPRVKTCRRAALSLVAVMTVALGLGIRTLFDGTWTGPVGDALYAVLIYLLVALAVPRRPRALIAAVALVVCSLIELLQLPGLPAALGATWPPLRLVLGTTFGTADLIAYAAGCFLAYTADRLLSNASGSKQPPSPPLTPNQYH
jgi:hypothetical protein